MSRSECSGSEMFEEEGLTHFLSIISAPILVGVGVKELNSSRGPVGKAMGFAFVCCGSGLTCGSIMKRAVPTLPNTFTTTFLPTSLLLATIGIVAILSASRILVFGLLGVPAVIVVAYMSWPENIGHPLQGIVFGVLAGAVYAPLLRVRYDVDLDDIYLLENAMAKSAIVTGGWVAIFGIAPIWRDIVYGFFG